MLAVAPPAARAECTSDIGCFSIRLEGDSAAQFDNATVESGQDYGVDVDYGKDHQSLFASIWDSDGNMLVNITGAKGGYCIFEIDGGEAYSPFLQLEEQKGLACKFIPEKSTGSGSDPQTFFYTVKLVRHDDASVDCNSNNPYAPGNCTQPPDPPPARPDKGMQAIKRGVRRERKQVEKLFTLSK